jgi:hypothetical protein
MKTLLAAIICLLCLRASADWWWESEDTNSWHWITNHYHSIIIGTNKYIPAGPLGKVDEGVWHGLKPELRATNIIFAGRSTVTNSGPAETSFRGRIRTNLPNAPSEYIPYNHIGTDDEGRPHIYARETIEDAILATRPMTAVTNLTYPTAYYRSYDWHACQFTTNYLPPVDCNRDSNGRVTNMIIYQSYTGTIQIGENFYHLNTVTNITQELVK